MDLERDYSNNNSNGNGNSNSSNKPDPLTARPNGRAVNANAPLVISTPSQRKNLFSRLPQQASKDKENSKPSPSPGAGAGATMTSSNRDRDRDRTVRPRAASSMSASDHRMKGTSSPTPSSSATKIPRPASSHRTATTTTTTSQPRRALLSIADAYKMAEFDDDTTHQVQASPSPAPRPWRGRGEIGDGRLRRAFSQGVADLTPQRRRPRKSAAAAAAAAVAPTYVHEDTASSVDDSSAKLSDVSEGDFDQKLQQHALEEQAKSRANGLAAAIADSIFAKTRLGPKIVEAGKELVRKASNNSLGNNNNNSANHTPSPRSSGGRRESGSWLARRLSSRKSSDANGLAALEPVTDGEQQFGTPAAEARSTMNGILSTTPPTARSSTVPPDYPSRSPGGGAFSWQVDEDFTAGDLQVSSSPPVHVGRTNRKIDEIRALEEDVNDRLTTGFEPRLLTNVGVGVGVVGVTIDGIGRGRAGMDSAPRSPAGSSAGDGGASRADSSEDSSSLRQNRQLARTNSKIDEVRAREMEHLSRRALATERLEALRAQNAEHRSRSSSPAPAPALDVGVGAGSSASSEPPLASPLPLLADSMAVKLDDAFGVVPLDEQGEPAPDPVVAAVMEPIGEAKETPAENVVEKGKDGAAAATTVVDDVEESRSSRGSKEDSRELLRRLARATSSSPAPDRTATAPNPNDGGRADGGEQEGQEEERKKKDPPQQEDVRQQRRAEGAKGDFRPTVGFAGIRRDSSVDSRTSKRSSRAHSENDPTERILGEMKLFAPQDNHSERNSLRAPSPFEIDLISDETPRPSRMSQLLMQATPRVTGAYVETPATARIDKADNSAKDFTDADNLAGLQNGAMSDGAETETTVTQAKSARAFQLPWLNRGRKTNSSPRKHKHALSMSTKGDRASGRSLSVSAHRRAKSVPRERTPLINSAKPPTVKDDLLEIQRAYQADDSTLDDFADLLGAQTDDSLDNDNNNRVEADNKQPKVKSEPDSGSSDRQRREIEQELEAYDRMSKTLKTGLLGIRTAKKGIELLEDKVSHSHHSRHSQSSHLVHPDNMQIKREPKPAEAEIPASIKSSPAHVASPPQPQTSSSSSSSSVTYIYIPVPRLWHRQPHFRFTWLGLLVLLLSLWYAAESTMCSLYCKPQYCHPGQPCAWSPDDPFWGYALPVKLDQWTTGGQGRAFVDAIAPDVADWLADAWDGLTGASPADLAAADTSGYSWAQKQQHRRRLARWGLVPGQRFVEPPEDGAVFAAWRAARLARERADAAREMGYPVPSGEEDESMAGDERVR